MQLLAHAPIVFNCYLADITGTMDHDLSKWLKDDLGLKHASESDLNDLFYHPTHGGLCRRFIKFLAESTLCAHKYPDVFAAEHCADAEQELKNRNRDLKNVIKQVEQYAKDNENEERQLSFLRLKLDHLHKIMDLQQTSKEALEAMAERPNLEIDQMARNVEDSQYLTKSDLAAIYTRPDFNRLDRLMVSRQRVLPIHEDINNLTKEIEMMQSAVSVALPEVIKKLESIDCNHLDLVKVRTDNLIAFKEPKFEVMTLNSELEGHTELSKSMAKKVCDLDQEVRELSTRYRSDTDELIKSAKKKIEKCLDILNYLEESEDANFDVNMSLVCD